MSNQRSAPKLGFFDRVAKAWAEKTAQERPVAPYKSYVVRNGNHVLVGRPKPLAKSFRSAYETGRRLNITVKA